MPSVEKLKMLRIAVASSRYRNSTVARAIKPSVMNSNLAPALLLYARAETMLRKTAIVRLAMCSTM